MPENLDIIVQLAHHILLDTHVQVERVHEGVSTRVYRVRSDDEIVYLRILPEQEASFAPEVLVHQILAAKHVKVPEVIYFEHYHPQLERSVMATTEIPGCALGYGVNLTNVQRILVDAGKDLATINCIAVEGFGWIQRNHQEASALRGNYVTYRQWMYQNIREHLAVLGRADILDTMEVRAVAGILLHYDSYFDGNAAYLAHGDFDVTHIYHNEQRYSGIIDFGEMRGANQWYDLGHFNIEHHEGLPYLLAGYQEMVQLPTDVLQRIHFSSLLIALRRAGLRQVKHPGALYQPDVEAIERTIEILAT